MEWIKIKDRLPADGLNHICWNPKIGDWQMAYMDCADGKWYTPKGHQVEITHWFRPEPPKEPK